MELRHPPVASLVPRTGSIILNLVALLAAGAIVMPVSSDPGDAPAPDTLRIGDRAPALPACEWVLGTPPSRLDAPGQTTVLVFWAPWCPASRLFLAREDSLRARADGPRAPIFAIAPEDPRRLRAFVQAAGWKNLAIGADPDREVLRAVFDAATASGTIPRLLPFGAIVGDTGETGPGTVLCQGPILDLDPATADPLAGFERALAQIGEGRYDLAAAARTEREQERSVELLAELFAAKRADDLDRLAALLDELDGIAIAPGYSGMTLVGNLNGLIWDLVTREGHARRHLEVAARAVEIASAAGGDTDAAFVDTHARLLYEQGRLREACEMQRRALDLARGGPAEPETAETLRRYAREAGVSADDPLLEGLAPGTGGTAESTVSPGAPTGFWQGTLNDAHVQFPPERCLLVGPAVSADSADEAAWSSEIGWLTERFYAGSIVRRSDEATLEELATRAVTLYGTPADNEWTREVLGRHGIEVTNAGVRLGEVDIAVERPILIACLPSPWNPALPVRIYTAARGDDSHNLNAFFHGPTALVIGQWRDGRPEVAHSLDFAARAPRDTALACGLALASGTLSAPEAREDLQALARELRGAYAGYADLDWGMGVRGSSWAEWTRMCEERIGARDRWSWPDFFELIREYLAPVEDAHFFVAGSALVEGRLEYRRAGFARHQAAFFSDLLIFEDGGDFLIRWTPEALAPWRGWKVDGAPIVPEPREVVPGVPYLFPTLARSPDDSASISSAYLLGMLADRDQPPESLRVRLLPARAAEGTGGEAAGAQPLALPLHRGRAHLAAAPDAPWKMTLPPAAPLPRLAVRTANPALLADLPVTADTLRALPRVLLDLRANGGGSDLPALQWCQRFSGQPFDWVCSVVRWPNRSEPLRSWVSSVAEPRTAPSGPGQVKPASPYAGTLFVLVDKGVASSGETFTHLAGQVPGAILLGENTAGCVSYGNVQERPALPHSGIVVRFGVTKFILDWVRPTREGIGFFPDYWLDTADPERLIARLTAGTRASGDDGRGARGDRLTPGPRRSSLSSVSSSPSGPATSR